MLQNAPKRSPIIIRSPYSIKMFYAENMGIGCSAKERGMMHLSIMLVSYPNLLNTSHFNQENERFDQQKGLQ